MIIYYSDAYSGAKGESHRLLRQAIGKHTGDTGQAGTMLDEMKKGPQGKPYIDGFSSFSISHTGSVWAVLIADEECGLDIQLGKSCRMQAMAERVYAPEDAAAVAEAIADGSLSDAEDVFFRIWTRREALAKAMGSTAFDSTLPSVATGIVRAGGKAYTIRDTELPGIPELYAAICLEGETAQNNVSFKKI